MTDAEMDAAWAAALVAVRREAEQPEEVRAQRRRNLLRWLDGPMSRKAEEKK